MVFQGRPAPLLHTVTVVCLLQCQDLQLLPAVAAENKSIFFYETTSDTWSPFSCDSSQDRSSSALVWLAVNHSLCRKHLDPLAQQQSHNTLMLDFAVSLQSVKVQVCVCVWGGHISKQN